MKLTLFFLGLKSHLDYERMNTGKLIILLTKSKIRKINKRMKKLAKKKIKSSLRSLVKRVKK